jgi:hypothetical protein
LPQSRLFANQDWDINPPAQVEKIVVEEISLEPEIQVRTGNIVAGPTLETSAAFELLQPAVMLEAMQALEVDVQESSGNYEPIEENSAAEVGLSFDAEACREDTKKTRFLNVPKQGIKRSRRGTIEAVFQPNGNIVQAQYNRCGILIEVRVGGAMKLTRAADTGKWTMYYMDGSQPVNRVKGVAFDRLGNLSYSTEDGRTTVICADGRVIEK